MDAKRKFVKPLAWALITCLAFNAAAYLVHQQAPGTSAPAHDIRPPGINPGAVAPMHARVSELPVSVASSLKAVDDLDDDGTSVPPPVAELPPLAGGALPIELAGIKAPDANSLRLNVLHTGGAGEVRRVSYEEAEGQHAQGRPDSRAANAPATVGHSEAAGGTSKGLQVDSTPDNILELIRRLASSDALVVEGARAHLTRQGFSLVELELAERISRSGVAERAQIVRELPGMPGIDARQWLVGLAGDTDAEVRLAAIGVLATSGDAAMLLKLEELAAADADPRIREQVPRLRKLRAAAQR